MGGLFVGAKSSKIVRQLWIIVATATGQAACSKYSIGSKVELVSLVIRSVDAHLASELVS